MADMKETKERRRFPFLRSTPDRDGMKAVPIVALKDIELKNTARPTHTEEASPIPSANGSNIKLNGSSSNSVHDVTPEKPKDENPPAKFKATFNFTTSKENKILIPGVLLALAAGVFKFMMSVFLGLIFDVIAPYMSGQISGPKLIKDVSRRRAILTGIECANWFLNGFVFVFCVFIGSAGEEFEGTDV